MGVKKLFKTTAAIALCARRRFPLARIVENGTKVTAVRYKYLELVTQYDFAAIALRGSMRFVPSTRRFGAVILDQGEEVEHNLY